MFYFLKISIGKIRSVQNLIILLNIFFINIYIIFLLYSICLYTGKEKFECLDIACSYFVSEIQNLQANGFIDKSDKTWPTELFFSGDWKIMQLLLGLKAPTSTFFCLYCECNKNQRSNMDIKWTNGENKKGIFI